ncbi:MAG TPA: hypothetical protein VNA23_08415 [Anaerolineales bacterium]|nr:hypothetical protein [Anaerolineales bacterium]
MKIIKELTRQGLQAQAEFIDAARARHLLWADNADNVETTRLHLDAAHAFAQVLLQLKRLLVEKYGEPLA